MISQNFAYFFKLANVFLDVVMPHGCMGILPVKEGWIQVLAGCQILIMIFLNKKEISLNFDYFFKLANVFLGVFMPHGCMGILPMKEDWIQVLAGCQTLIMMT